MFDRAKLSSNHTPRALRLLALAIVVALIFAGNTLTQAKQTSTPKAAAQVFPIKIIYTAGTPPSVTISPDSQELGANDEVKWSCQGCAAAHVSWVVVFRDSNRKPFQGQIFHGGKSQSGKPTSVPLPGQKVRYKYSVVVGDIEIDPDVIIKGG